jgi:hypothetical protein
MWLGMAHFRHAGRQVLLHDFAATGIIEMIAAKMIMIP